MIVTFKEKQIFRPATARKRKNKTVINLTNECPNYKYVRYILPDGRVYFVPSNTQRPECVDAEIRGNPVVPKRDGNRLYVPMPPRTVGTRYRRIRNKTTGVVELTAVYRPPEKRNRETEEEQ